MGCYKQRVKLLVIRKEGTTASLPKVYSVVSEPGVVKMKAFTLGFLLVSLVFVNCSKLVLKDMKIIKYRTEQQINNKQTIHYQQQSIKSSSFNHQSIQ